MKITQTGLQQTPCSYCGAYHQGVCPRVESIEYHGDGSIKRVTLRPPNERQKVSKITC